MSHEFEPLYSFVEIIFSLMRVFSKSLALHCNVNDVTLAQNLQRVLVFRNPYFAQFKH